MSSTQKQHRRRSGRTTGRAPARPLRRRADCRLFRRLGESSWDCPRAFAYLARGFELATSGGGVAIGRYGADLAVPGRSRGADWSAAGSTRQSDDQAQIVRDYLDWARRLSGDRTDPDARLRHAAALDVIAFGESCATVDRERRRRKGWAVANLIACLEVFCRVKGWGTAAQPSATRPAPARPPMRHIHTSSSRSRSKSDEKNIRYA